MIVLLSTKVINLMKQIHFFNKSSLKGLFMASKLLSCLGREARIEGILCSYAWIFVFGFISCIFGLSPSETWGEHKCH